MLIETFISYCHKNKIYMKYVKKILEDHKNVAVNVDESGLTEGTNISAFMDSLKKNDLIIIIVTNEYLHSRNCMYEISRLVETIDYKRKVFPVVFENQIYDVVQSAQIIEYWEKEERKTQEEIKNLKPVNTGDLVHELQIIQDIQRSLGEALPFLRDRNNPDIDNLENALNNKLTQLEKIKEVAGNNDSQNTGIDFFEQTNLSVPQQNSNTDLAKNEFLVKSYTEIIKAMDQMLSALSRRRTDIQTVKRKDGVYELYKDGILLKYIAIRNEGQGLFSDCITLSAERFLTQGSCNEQYRAKYQDGRFVLEGLFAHSVTQNEYFNAADEVVADIFNRFIKPDISYN